MRVIMDALHMKTYNVQNAYATWPPIGRIIEAPGVGAVTCLGDRIYSFSYNGATYSILKFSESAVAMNGDKEVLAKLYEVLPSDNDRARCSEGIPRLLWRWHM